MEELRNPFEDAFTLWCAYRGDAGFRFWLSPLKHQFQSTEDYLQQAAEYRRQHNLKPIDQLTKQDVEEYREWYRNEKDKLRKEFLAKDI